jgi:hypothetical protein
MIYDLAEGSENYWMSALQPVRSQWKCTLCHEVSIFHCFACMCMRWKTPLHILTNITPSGLSFSLVATAVGDTGNIRESTVGRFGGYVCSLSPNKKIVTHIWNYISCSVSSYVSVHCVLNVNFLHTATSSVHLSIWITAYKPKYIFTNIWFTFTWNMNSWAGILNL